MMSGQLPASGAWQKAKLWEYLSGDQLGCTWHLEFKMVYSPDKPIPGADEVEDMGVPGFYFVDYDEWISGPKGKKLKADEQEVRSTTVKPSINFWK